MTVPRCHPPDFTFTTPTKWQTCRVIDMKAFQKNPVYTMMQEGSVPTGNTFWTAAHRFHMMKTVVISSLYEYQTDVLKERWTFKPGGDRCETCGTANDLKSCGRCLKVDYCSRECQMKDWKRHKTSCNAK
eukprot:TRINITY_DN6468_c0_g2_i1.p1 TRINITY_DN6468_c0_g2~~TRINITY_DN6468_c0_g2_i1.p1  ORF type:complete len:130 (-),score=9.71 TRINITY_DN6468_c0_g2_i1:687-1076(-)